MTEAQLGEKEFTANAPVGTVTFLFTDIEGSTQLLEALREQYAVVLGDQRELLRSAFAQWNGHEIDTQGDAFFVAFSRAADAVHCVVEAQRAIAEHGWPNEVNVRVRMGLYTGEPLVTTEGYIGMDVHRAARIGSAGHGGQVLLAQTTRDLIFQDLPEGVSLRDLGAHKLKDIRHPQQIYQLDIDGLQSEFAPLKTLATDEEPPTPGEPPYKGLQYFDTGDAEWFFGRETVTAKLEQAVRQQRFLAVVGASGSGKSSVVRAGLLPALQADKVPWMTQVMTPTAHPLEALALSLTQDSDSVAATATLIDDLADDPRSLYLFAQKLLAGEDDVDHLLLVVDQFEELFTLCRKEVERSAFVDNLVIASAEADTPIEILITLRADFYEHLAAYPRLCQMVAQQQEYVLAMDIDELRQVIDGPAEKGGWEFSPGLVDLILHDVGASEGRQPEPGALPLLSHALLETWKRRRGNVMTLKAYAESGGVRGAIAHSAERVYYQELDADQRDIARRIFLRLTELGEGTQDTRRRAAINELVPTDGDPEAWKAVLVKLADARLVTTSEDTAEVAHEALIREWPTLREWLAEDREGLRLHRQLTEAAQEWELLERDLGALYRGARLAQALEWERANPHELNPSEQAFLFASRDEAERKQIVRERRRRLTVIGLAAGLVLAVGLSMFAFSQSNRAQEEAQARATAQVEAETEAIARGEAQEEAELQRNAALVQASIGLASQSALELEGSFPERSVLLALEALENYPYTWQAERALGQAFLENRLQHSLVHEAWVNSAKWSPHKTRVATASDDGTAVIWDADTGEKILTLHHDDWVVAASWSPSGKRILTESNDGTVNVWDAEKGELQFSLNGHGEFPRSEWSPSGNRIVTSNHQESIAFWDAESGEHLLSIPSRDFCSDLTGCGLVSPWSPSDDKVVTRQDDGTIEVWDAATGDQILSISGHDGFIGTVAWSPDGTMIVSGGDDGFAKVWSAESGEEIASLVGHEDQILAANWSPDGHRIVTTSWDGLAKVWNPKTGEQLANLDGHIAPVHTGAWSPDGQRIATVGRDGTAKIWDVFTGNLLETFFGHQSGAWYVDWSASGENIVSSSGDGTAKIWELASEADEFEIPGPDGGAFAVAWSPGHSQIARGYRDGRAIVFDAVTQNEIYVLDAHDGWVVEIAWSPSGDRLYTAGSFDDTAKVWDAANGELLTTLTRPGDVFDKGSWSPDGTRIVTSTNEGAIVWEADTGQVVLEYDEHSSSSPIAKWSPDGRFIATGDSGGSARIWNAATGETLFDLFPEDHQLGITYLAFSPDGSRLATHGDDGLWIWDSETGALIVNSAGHRAEVYSIDWFPAGDRIISTDFAGFFKVFDALTGTELLSTQMDLGGTGRLSRDGKLFAFAETFNGPLRVFSLWQSMDELIEFARECCVFRELTQQEREQFGLPPIETN